jgi:hypothetical protein
MYHLSKKETLQLRQYVFNLRNRGFIQESSSLAGTLIFFVKTTGKAEHPCVDYQLLNSMTVRDSYPLPVIAKLSNSLSGCRYLSKIDLKGAFHLLQVALGHEWKTAFQTPWGPFEYLVMPFGLANAPAIFQCFIQHCLHEFLDICCFVYIDDILVFSKTREQHVIDLQNVLGKLQHHSLKASLQKFQFFQSSVKFLGFVISSKGLKMEEGKLVTILDWPLPSSLKQLHRFLGFCNFYR